MLAAVGTTSTRTFRESSVESSSPYPPDGVYGCVQVGDWSSGDAIHVAFATQVDFSVYDCHGRADHPDGPPLSASAQDLCSQTLQKRQGRLDIAGLVWGVLPLYG